MFSPVGGPGEDDQEIDWIDDLKFYIDNEDRMLEKYFFPAIKKHEKHIGNPNVYKIYLKAIRPCLQDYCKTFDVEKPEEKFSEDALIELAKNMAAQQEKFIENGEYKKEKTDEAAGVGIITKQNTTKDVNKDTPRKNLKAFKLI